MSTLTKVERAAWRAARDSHVLRANALHRGAHPAEVAAVEAYHRATCLAWAEARLIAHADTDDRAE